MYKILHFRHILLYPQLGERPRRYSNALYHLFTPHTSVESSTVIYNCHNVMTAAYWCCLLIFVDFSRTHRSFATGERRNMHLTSCRYVAIKAYARWLPIDQCCSGCFNTRTGSLREALLERGPASFDTQSRLCLHKGPWRQIFSVKYNVGSSVTLVLLTNKINRPLVTYNKGRWI